jgi:hypothetical protein
MPGPLVNRIDAEDGDPAGVSAERGDFFPDPAERGDLIQERRVGRRSGEVPEPLAYLGSGPA